MIAPLLRWRGFQVAVLAALIGAWGSPCTAQLRVGTPATVIDTSPAPVLPPTVQEVSLHNPRNREAKTYIDFDTGKTFTWGESKPEDFTGSRKWINTSGADLMCETTAPADGFASYDLVLVPANDTFEHMADYNVINTQLRTLEARPFDLVKIGKKLPATYLFKTREGAIGVLEIIAMDTADEDLKLRFKILQKPPTPASPVRLQRFGQNGVIIINNGVAVANGVFLRDNGARFDMNAVPQVAPQPPVPFSVDNFRLDRPLPKASTTDLPVMSGGPRWFLSEPAAAPAVNNVNIDGGTITANGRTR